MEILKIRKRHFLQSYFILIFIIITNLNVYGEIFRYADRNGVWHFTNRSTDSRYRRYIRSTNPNLKNNSLAAETPTGQKVYNAQKSLKSLMYYSGKIDGVWGKMTRNAIERFQRDKGLEVNGLLDYPTSIALKKGTQIKPPSIITENAHPKIFPPVVFFKSPSAKKIIVHDPYINIRAGAKSLDEEAIKDIWIMVNGKRVETIQDVKDTGEGLEAQLELTVPLNEEENIISIVASNRYAQSDPDMVYVKWEKKKPNLGEGERVFKPNLYLLAIGVSRHQDSRYNLDSAHKDADGIGRVFENQEGKLYQAVHKRILTNHEATRTQILDALDWIYKQSTQRDTSIIFIAGHGMKDSVGNYYFLPYDGNPRKLMKTAVKWSNFQNIISALPSKVILMADTCHSGSITGKRRGVSRMNEVIRELINTDSGVIVMTASTGREESQERPEWGHGAFTKALIEGLEGRANYNGDKTVDMKELDNFVTDRVKELTGGTQHPTTEIPKTMPSFPLIYEQKFMLNRK